MADYREKRIPKRDGTYRTVVVPSRALRRRLKADLPKLTAIGMALDVYGVAHGFVPGRSPVTCAMAHRGYQYSLCMDLSDCFGHITKELILKATGNQGPEVTGECLYKGRAAQGLPTSPALCNIALAPMDAEIVQWLGFSGVYTRYADDLTISSDSWVVISEAMNKIPAIAYKHGQSVAPHKTHVQDAKAGRRIIVGVAVDDTSIKPTRAAKRRLRAAQHQRKRDHARGLAEWCKLVPPNAGRAVNKYLSNSNVWHQRCAVLVAQQAVANQ